MAPKQLQKQVENNGTAIFLADRDWTNTQRTKNHVVKKLLLTMDITQNVHEHTRFTISS